jgi:hypothetical protein
MLKMNQNVVEKLKSAYPEKWNMKKIGRLVKVKAPRIGRLVSPRIFLKSGKNGSKGKD